MSGALSADPGVRCQADVLPDPGLMVIEGLGCRLCGVDEDSGLLVCTERCEPHQCGQVSRFVVSRSDADPSYGIDGHHETCETHLSGVVLAMAGGDSKVRLVVRPRWDA